MPLFGRNIIPYSRSGLKKKCNSLGNLRLFELWNILFQQYMSEILLKIKTISKILAEKPRKHKYMLDPLDLELKIFVLSLAYLGTAHVQIILYLA